MEWLFTDGPQPVVGVAGATLAGASMVVALVLRQRATAHSGTLAAVFVADASSVLRVVAIALAVLSASVAFGADGLGNPLWLALAVLGAAVAMGLLAWRWRAAVAAHGGLAAADNTNGESRAWRRLDRLGDRYRRRRRHGSADLSGHRRPRLRSPTPLDTGADWRTTWLRGRHRRRHIPLSFPITGPLDDRSSSLASHPTRQRHFGRAGRGVHRHHQARSSDFIDSMIRVRAGRRGGRERASRERARRNSCLGRRGHRGADRRARAAAPVAGELVLTPEPRHLTD